MRDALIGTGFPFREGQEGIMDNYFAQAKNIAIETAGIRRAGAASLDLAYVAAGRLDGFWEYGLQNWDIAAGVLIVQEAGGLVSDPKGGQDFFKQGNLVCANPKLFKPLLQTLNR
jgi:myo-inositol-1(or 4)-monophosphatase